MHCGIYGPLGDDAYNESLAAAQGGVTSSLNYMRTGGYYMEKGGPYAKVYPEVLDISKDRFWVDYAYHLAPLDRTHIGEIDMLIEEVRRHLVQDLHVLRRLRPARRLATRSASS
jgi:allantoinase